MTPMDFLNQVRNEFPHLSNSQQREIAIQRFIALHAEKGGVHGDSKENKAT